MSDKAEPSPTSVSAETSPDSSNTESTASQRSEHVHSSSQLNYLGVLVLGALGVVYGDIGTSPLYALRECFYGSHSIAPTPGNVLGVLSLIIWSLLFIVSFKYLLFVMRADNRGEGGVLALLALLRTRDNLCRGVLGRMTLWLGLFGAVLLYGDGAITPAISVLSAVEGLEVITPMFSPFVLPITFTILVILFAVQRRGTGKLGLIFGPIILLWFLTLAVLGVRGILLYPQVFESLSPHHGFRFFAENGWGGTIVLGAVFLSVTGAEALYADMGHFGPKPIRIGWFTIVLPALLLNYLGQGALILHSKQPLTSPFYELAPTWALYPLVALATAATVIASQALISGAFSITSQAIQFGFLPRLQVLHTSSREIGQIYVPVVNVLLFLLTVALVVGFRTSGNLAAAYGIAVSATMAVTSVLIYLAAVRLWHWPRRWTVPLLIIFLGVDGAFLFGNLAKIPDGGWVPILLGIILFTVMTTWLRGREILADRLAEHGMPMEDFLKLAQKEYPFRVRGTAVFMARDIQRTPTALLHNTRHNRIIHERVILLQVVTLDQPYVPQAERMRIEHILGGFYRVYLNYGFMEAPNVPAELAKTEIGGHPIEPESVTYFLGREIILATKRDGMLLWRERLFSFLTQVALRATAFYQIPAEQVVEIGTQVEM